MENKSNISIGKSNHIIWQTFKNDPRPKLRVHINGIVIIAFIYTGTAVSVITVKSWYSNWLLEKADVKLLGIGTISLLKQRT